MISVSKRFAGFRTPASVLEDRHLSNEQKRTALLAWRASLSKAPRAISRDGRSPAELIEEIDEALKALRREKTSLGKGS
ncbi:hypothetical protein FIV06_12610 [Labrenzia sp. THAF191b]|jgi:hypothetical protein|uniref:hypothetical protein n=1 Tax=unclassified Labrenzia TaxID=2648686 RepID=UPI00126874C4|nr:MULTISPECIES: hypothetical protein [unclassified Labrenzia]QFS98261.1 hypothetical protein FIV06_12610 [Labrenzia sp. THAF191b]QFT04575.1 hypothetical protein FIV05_12605 [Labrenzia sp. THAF191a]QFT16119.1 hypothetical protein FIV03_12620 [Labrenzia sp. THAF187b]